MTSDTVRDDFATGEMNAWESYPIARTPGSTRNMVRPRAGLGGKPLSSARYLTERHGLAPDRTCGADKKIRSGRAPYAARPGGLRGGRPARPRRSVVLYGIRPEIHLFAGRAPANDGSIGRLFRLRPRGSLGTRVLPGAVTVVAVTGR